MIRHLFITQSGSYLGFQNELVSISIRKEIQKEISIRRLKTIQILTKNVSISGHLIYQCSIRGIHIFIIDHRNQISSMLFAPHHHATVKIREKQIDFTKNNESFQVAKEIIYGKIRNQRVVLLYFGKYLSQPETKKSEEELKKIAYKVKNMNFTYNWKEQLLGLEGIAAQIYWQTVKNHILNHLNFPGRLPRNSLDIVNTCLNIGYTILMNMIWRSITIAGLEPYLGFYHSQKAGKPSLVLDLMEEYRAWIVDRNVFKLRNQLKKQKQLQPKIKKKLIHNIIETFTQIYPYHKQQYKLETIIQKQIYRFCGSIMERKPYQSYIFRW